MLLAQTSFVRGGSRQFFFFEQHPDEEQLFKCVYGTDMLFLGGDAELFAGG